MVPGAGRPLSSVSDVSPDYRSLHKYLTGRFADTVTLTFVQIEELLGRTLPILAYSEPGWWSGPAAGTPPSPQSSSWFLAERVATVNLLARTVMFDRA
jgi:hypothetical protein